ncbi:hypothetical protein CHGG_00093 [Chaetomium globosum CBS 148.51]|uniref:Uncharacterized protein n=1 Tax=Chaetomium globosum (strain ATCC 6205 / CBS 148.51 / DSM 1962 / NBRC 6347 / NRRL 1970) TaxID=306901 RepID=Q2HI61_CHAGB|nr:uncharacterized protein CHGG_00093 [Chaetomium globosum CBS 148.51]EAQ91858.1 hypothetical protein CHGG_00093 [Chaetomium globosum CBS 148.51]
MLSLRYACAILGLCLFALSNGAAAATTDSPLSLQEGYTDLPDCASACAAVEAACLCGDAKFNKAATGCIQLSCSIRESLAAKNITELMCGHSPERDASLIPVYSVFIGLAVVAVMLRLVARVLTHAYFWWDDFANLFGFMFFVEMLLYTITRFFVRASIILFYLRVFPPSQDNKLGRILQYTMIFNVVYNISFLFAVIFQCTPISDFWTQWEGIHQGRCGNANILAWVAAATGIAFDVWLLALPFPQLLALNLHWKKKKDIVQVCLWSGIELDVGVICPCLPSFRLLLRRLLPRVMGTASSRYELDPVSGTNLTGTGAGMGGGGVRSAVRGSRGGSGSFGRGGGNRSGGGDGGGGVGKIVVENTIAIKYGRSGELDDDDGVSCESVRGLVEGRASSVEDEESGRKSIGRRGR